MQVSIKVSYYIYVYKGKRKVVPVLFNLATRLDGVLESGGIASRILDLGTRRR
jgi:hypothetical protein